MCSVELNCTDWSCKTFKGKLLRPLTELIADNMQFWYVVIACDTMIDINVIVWYAEMISCRWLNWRDDVYKGGGGARDVDHGDKQTDPQQQSVANIILYKHKAFPQFDLLFCICLTVIFKKRKRKRKRSIATLSVQFSSVQFCSVLCCSVLCCAVLRVTEKGICLFQIPATILTVQWSRTKRRSTLCSSRWTDAHRAENEQNCQHSIAEKWSDLSVGFPDHGGQGLRNSSHHSKGFIF